MKIALVGASGYGNVGDDTYPLVFREQLAEHKIVVFNSDLPAAMPPGVDLLVFGGGGLIYNTVMEPPEAESPHFCQMKFYLEWARSEGVPWGFSSCGFQFEGDQSGRNKRALEPWKPWLRGARFITLRSPACQRLAVELAGREDSRFFPDAACLYAPRVRTKASRVKTLTIVPAGVVRPGEPALVHLLRPYLGMKDWRVVWMNMGAPRDGEGHMAAAREQHPSHALIPATTPKDAFQQIAASSLVITGRYHGMVFARACGVPFITFPDAPYKIEQEDFTADPASARGHFDVLRRVIASLDGRARRPRQLTGAGQKS
jgi:hypothetical protein